MGSVFGDIRRIPRSRMPLMHLYHAYCDSHMQMVDRQQLWFLHSEYRLEHACQSCQLRHLHHIVFVLGVRLLQLRASHVHAGVP